MNNENMYYWRTDKSYSEFKSIRAKMMWFCIIEFVVVLGKYLIKPIISNGIDTTISFFTVAVLVGLTYYFAKLLGEYDLIKPFVFRLDEIDYKKRRSLSNYRKIHIMIPEFTYVLCYVILSGLIVDQLLVDLFVKI